MGAADRKLSGVKCVSYDDRLIEMASLSSKYWPEDETHPYLELV